MKEEPEPDSSKINRHAQFALINHKKYKYNDLCILFMDGTCLWREGFIQSGLKKYPMSRLTKRMVQHEYKKLYGRQDNFGHVVLRYLTMTSMVMGLLWIGILMGGHNKSREEKATHDAMVRTAQAKYEQIQTNVAYLCDTINNNHNR